MKLLNNVVEFGKKEFVKSVGLALIGGAVLGIAAKTLLGGKGLSDTDLEDEYDDELEDLEEIETDEEVDSKD